MLRPNAERLLQTIARAPIAAGAGAGAGAVVVVAQTGMCVLLFELCPGSLT